MGSVRRRLRVRAFFALAVVGLTLSATQASGAKAPADATCTWGASSVRAQVVDGRIVASPPVQTGCLGR
jgi:hypothetical protein